jgi:hypothetical protein
LLNYPPHSVVASSSDSIFREKGFEAVWPAWGRAAPLTAHYLDLLYIPPLFFDFEWSPKLNPPITPKNVAVRAAELVGELRLRAQEFRHSNVM